MSQLLKGILTSNILKTEVQTEEIIRNDATHQGK